MRLATLQRGASKYNGPAAIGMLEEALARFARESNESIYRPWNIREVASSPAGSNVLHARPWDCILTNATAAPMTILLPNPADTDVVGTPVMVHAAGLRAHAVTMQATSGIIERDGDSCVIAAPDGHVVLLSTGQRWIRIGGLMRSGERLLNTEYSPIGLWDGTQGSAAGFPDVSGNGNNMTLETGTARHNSLSPTMASIHLAGDSNWYVSTYQSALALTGDMSTLALLVMLEPPAAGTKGVVVSHTGTPADETAAHNVLYEQSALEVAGVRYFSEDNAGVNSVYDINAWIGRGQVSLVGFTRTSNVIQQYGGGAVFGAASGTLTTPTGGTSGRLRIGGTGAAGGYLNALVACVAVYNRALTAAEMLERYNWCLGAKYGWRAS